MEWAASRSAPARRGLRELLSAMLAVGDVDAEEQHAPARLFDPARGFLRVVMLVQIVDGDVKPVPAPKLIATIGGVMAGVSS